MRHTLTKKRTSRLEKNLALLFFVVLELGIGLYVWRESKPHARFGFLVKNGEQYLLLWKNEVDEVLSSTHGSLGEALEIARTELAMETMPGPQSRSVEHLWIRSDIGRAVLYWKTYELSSLNRLSFKNEKDALLFEKAFRGGAYSTSPFGHSISLMPVRQN